MSQRQSEDVGGQGDLEVHATTQYPRRNTLVPKRS